MRHMVRCTLLSSALILGLATLAVAGEIRVPDDFGTIWEAVDSASSGDTVIVGPGVWSDSVERVSPTGFPVKALVFLRPGVTLVSEAGPEATTLSYVGSGIGACVAHYESGVEEAVVQGFTLNSDDFGVTSVFSGPLRLVDCRVIGTHDSGISMRDATLVLEDCEIAECESGTTNLRGAVVGIDSGLVAERCVFQDNPEDAIDLTTAGRPVRIEDCVFSRNVGTGLKALGNPASYVARRCYFEDGGRALLPGGADGVIEYCTMVRMIGDPNGSGGAGVFCGGCNSVIRNNTFVDCTATTYGGLGSAIGLSGMDPGVSNNLFYNCDGPAAQIHLSFSGTQSPQTGCNLFLGGAPLPYGGQAFSTPGDLIGVDPQFCDYSSDDFTLMYGSPASADFSPICGPIGAYEVGCGTVGVEQESWSTVRSRFR